MKKAPTSPIPVPIENVPILMVKPPLMASGITNGAEIAATAHPPKNITIFIRKLFRISSSVTKSPSPEIAGETGSPVLYFKYAYVRINAPIMKHAIPINQNCPGISGNIVVTRIISRKKSEIKNRPIILIPKGNFRSVELIAFTKNFLLFLSELLISLSLDGILIL